MTIIYGHHWLPSYNSDITDMAHMLMQRKSQKNYVTTLRRSIFISIDYININQRCSAANFLNRYPIELTLE